MLTGTLESDVVSRRVGPNACRLIERIFCTARSEINSLKNNLLVSVRVVQYQLFTFFFFFEHHFYFPAQLVGRFTLSDLVDKTWSQVPSLLLPHKCVHFYRA